MAMTKRVPYIDYPRHYEAMRAGVMAAVDRVLCRGDLMLRADLRDFEEHLATFVGARHAIGVGNCSDALRLALLAAGVGAGDEVITVAHTFVATVAAIHHAGATPVLVDVGADHLMDPGAVEQAISPRTKVILPVHLNGRLCDMEPLSTLAKRHRLILIEDAAQGLGASLGANKGGTFGLAGCFSFYPAKILGAFGDGGAVVTNDVAFAGKIRALRNGGRLPNGDLIGWGWNSRLDNLQAAILDLKLNLLPGWIERRREIASRYQAKLAGLPGLVLPPAPAAATAATPPTAHSPRSESTARTTRTEPLAHTARIELTASSTRTGQQQRFDVFQNYEIETDDRDGLAAHLSIAGIETMLPWGGRAVHQFPALGFEGVRLPATERLFERLLLLPMHCELSDEQVDYVAGAICRYFDRAAPAGAAVERMKVGV
ncbi:MAG: DegT/DnrJ/EryC1/StrS family aminotransferase [Bryobacterales bacterium]